MNWFANRCPVRGCPAARRQVQNMIVLKPMKLIRMFIAFGCVCSLLAVSTPAADTPQKKLTCCEAAAAAGKECKHKCCVAAHKEGKSCEKCNPNKEDLKLKKPDRKPAAKADK